jgi:hypothetical protein
MSTDSRPSFQTFTLPTCSYTLTDDGPSRTPVILTLSPDRQDTKLFPSKLASKATIIANCGAVAGGITFGYLSQFSGRRLA